MAAVRSRPGDRKGDTMQCHPGKPEFIYKWLPGGLMAWEASCRVCYVLFGRGVTPDGPAVLEEWVVEDDDARKS